MNSLVVGNLVHRPLRSVISAVAVAIEIIMILSIAAIMLGMLNGQKVRTTGIGNDMIAKPGTTSNLMGVSGAPASAKIQQVLEGLPHVQVAAPVYIQLVASGTVENIYGINFDSFNALRPFTFKEGGPFTSPNEIIIDDVAAASGKVYHVGDVMRVLGRDFRISGIVEHGKGGRKFLPLETMNAINGTENRCSVFYLKTDNSPQWQAAVKGEIKGTDGLQQWDVQTLDEFLSMLTPERYPGFNIGLRVVIGIALVIGFIVIFQSMYTAVMERTREIGILKSLGASKAYIVGLVLRESGLLAVVGITVGILATYLLRAFLHFRFPQLEFAVTARWVMSAVLLALIGSTLGALYPAMKAAGKDPIEALAYE